MQPTSAPLKYEPALDGLRAVAIVLVVLFHAHTPGFQGGYLGVDVFFVLSGFLITQLMLHEYQATQRIDVGRFYRRRFFRLMPALLALLAVYVVVAPWVWPQRDDHWQQAALAGLYLSDYTRAFWKTPDLLSHTWSLSVEQHFYLVWPLFLWAALRRWDAKQLLKVLLTLWVIGMALRWAWVFRGQGWDEVYYRFDTRFTGLVLGAAAAVYAASRHGAGSLAKLPQIAVVLLAPLVALALQLRWMEFSALYYAMPAIELFTAAVMLVALHPGNVLGRWLSARPMVALGKLSYGLYLWHYPIFRYLRVEHEWYQVLLWGLPLSLGLAWLSYVSVERWGYALRDRLQMRKRLLAESKS